MHGSGRCVCALSHARDAWAWAVKGSSCPTAMHLGRCQSHNCMHACMHPGHHLAHDTEQTRGTPTMG